MVGDEVETHEQASVSTIERAPFELAISRCTSFRFIGIWRCAMLTNLLTTFDCPCTSG